MNKKLKLFILLLITIVCIIFGVFPRIAALIPQSPPFMMPISFTAGLTAFFIGPIAFVVFLNRFLKSIHQDCKIKQVVESSSIISAQTTQNTIVPERKTYYGMRKSIFFIMIILFCIFMLPAIILATSNILIKIWHLLVSFLTEVIAYFLTPSSYHSYESDNLAGLILLLPTLLFVAIAFFIAYSFVKLILILLDKNISK